MSTGSACAAGVGEAAALHGGVGFRRSVVERAEPPVERDRTVGVVDLEVLVVQVVGVAVGRQRAAAELDPFVARVARHRCHGEVEQREHGVDRVGRHHPVIATALKYRKCSTGCIDRPDHGAGLVLRWWRLWTAL